LFVAPFAAAPLARQSAPRFRQLLAFDAFGGRRPSIIRARRTVVRDDYPSGRPLPPGIILENYTEDVEVGRLKSGKEADVYVVQRIGPAGDCLLAAKRYKPLDQRAFRNDAAYTAHRRIDGFVRDIGGWRRPKQGRGTQRAMDKKSAYGKEVLEERWIQTEFEMLTKAWEAGAPVPYPVERLSDGVLMEYVGDEDRAAPRLVDARPPTDQLPDLYRQIGEAMRRFVQAGVVHADLSPYNILLWNGQIWIIDLPQAVPFLGVDAATDFLHRDVMNVGEWFVRRGLEIDPEDLFAELVNEAFELTMKDLFQAR
jgi:RIO kinase 1